MPSTNNNIELLIGVKADTAGSKAGIQQQLDKLSKELQGLNVGIGKIDDSGLKNYGASAKTANNEFEKLLRSGKAFKLVKDDMAVVAQATDKLGKSFGVVSKEAAQSLSQIKSQFKGQDFAIKPTFDLSSGQKVLAAVQVDVKKTEDLIERITYKLKKVGDGGKMGWEQTSINQIDKSAFSLSKNLDKAQSDLNLLNKQGKISNDTFNELSQKANKIGTSNGFTKFGQEIKMAVAHQKNLNDEMNKTALVQSKLSGTISGRSLSANKEAVAQAKSVNSALDTQYVKYQNINKVLEQHVFMQRLTQEQANKFKGNVGVQMSVEKLREQEALIGRQVVTNKRNTDELKRQVALQEQIRKLQNSITIAQGRNPGAFGNNAEVTSMLKTLRGIDVTSKGASTAVKGVSDNFQRMGAVATSAGRESLGVMQSFKIAMEKFPVWMAASTIFFQTLHGVKDAVRQIIELDSQMTVMRRVGGNSIQTNEILKESIRLAGELGNTISEVNEGFIEFARQGFRGQQLSDLTEMAVLLSNISDLSTSESSGILTAGIKAFNMETEKSIHIVNALNEVDNNYSVTTSQLATSMQRAAGTASVYGVSLERLLGYTTSIAEISRESGSVIGNSLKSIFSRITSVDGAIDALNGIGISIHNASGEIRKVDNILDDLGAQWKDLNVEQQQNLGLQIAGRYQLSRFLILMNQYDQAMNASATATDSVNSGYRENAEYLKSYTARINELKNAWTESVISMTNGGFGDGITIALGIGLELFKALNSVISTFGLFPVVIGASGIALGLFSDRFRMLLASITQTTVAFGNMASSAIRASTAPTPAIIAQAQVMNVLSTSTVRAAVSYDRLSVSTALTTNATRALTASTVSSTVATGALSGMINTATASARAFGATIATIAFPIAIFMALGGAISFVTSKAIEHQKAQKEMRKSIEDTLNKGVEAVSTNKEKVDELISSYKELSKEKENGNWNTGKEEKYLAVQKELSELFPTLIKYVDEKGRAHLKSSEGIDEEVKSMEALLNIKRQEKLEEASDTYKTRLKSVKEYYDTIESKENEIANKKKIMSEFDPDAYGHSKEEAERISKLAEDQLATLERELVYAQGMLATATGNMSQEVRGMFNTFLSMIGEDVVPQIQNEIANAFNEVNWGDKTAQEAEEIQKALANFAVEKSNAFNTGDLEKFNSVSKSLTDYLVGALGLSTTEARKLSASFDDLTASIELETKNQKEANKIIDDSAVSMGDLSDETYNLKDAMEQLSGVSQKHIDDTTQLTGEYDLLSKRLSLLTEGTLEYEAVNSQLDGVLSNLLDMYPSLSGESLTLIDRYEKLSQNAHASVVAQDELEEIMTKLLALHPSLDKANMNRNSLIETITQSIYKEKEANDILLKAMKALGDEKLTEEEKMTLAQLENTNARIKNINTEIEAMSKLADAYAGEYEKTKRAAEAGDEGAGRALMRMSVPTGKLQMLTAELASATAERGNYVNTLKASENVMGKTKDATNDQTKAQKESADAIEHSIFLTNKYKRAMELLTLEIKKQQDIQAKFPDYSKQHRDSLQAEIKLQQDKMALLQEQSKALDAQAKTGKILQTGVVTTSSEKNQKINGFGGAITSGYGYRTPPKKGASSNHQGIDIAGKNGSRVDSISNGTVTFAGNKGNGLGNYVAIKDASGNTNIYGHLQDVLVKAGQSIAEGMKLGTIGSTGTSTGNHLHFQQTDASGKSVDPTSVVNAARKGISSASKDVANVQQAVNNAQSEVLSLNGQIIDQQALIEKLKINIINSHVAGYGQKRESYDRALSFEAEKIKTLDVNSQRYGSTLERMGTFLEYKQKANREELAYLEGLIKNGNLSAIAMDTMKIKAEVLKTEMLSLADAISKNNYEVIMVSAKRFDESVSDLNYSLERSRLIMATLEEGSTAYSNEIKYQTQLLEQEAAATKAHREELQLKILTVKLGTEEYKSLDDQIKSLSLAYWGLQGSIKDSNKALEASSKKMAEDAADSLINSYKQYLEEKRDMHLRSIDNEMSVEDTRHKKVMDNYKKELDQFRKIVQERIDSIDKEESDNDYNKEIIKLEEERLEILSKINLLSMDDSYEAKSERKKLQESLSNIDETIEDKRHKREVDLRKENLNGMIKDKEEQIAKEEELENERHEEEKKRIDDLKSYWSQFYVDQLNDERKFAEMKKKIVAGNFDDLSAEFQSYMQEMIDTMPELENTLDGTMQAVGTSIRQNIIDNLREALGMLGDVKNNNTSVSGGISNGSGGTGGAGGATGSGASAMSSADMKVMTAKFLAEKVNREVKDTVRQGYIRDRASAMASQGRAEGSTLSSSQGYESLLGSMSKEDKTAFANYLNTVGVGTVSTPELQDFIRQYAKNLGSSVAQLSTGGYTGKFSGGKMAVLHEEEVILNKKETKDFFSILPSLKTLATLINPIKSPALPNIQRGDMSGSNTYEINFNVDKMTGNEADVNKFTKSFTDALKRNKGVR